MHTLGEIHKKNIVGLKNLILSGKIKSIINPVGLNIKYFKSGGGNHLYLIITENKKYLARVNFYPLKDDWKIKKHEYECLKLIEKLNIAPKAYFLDTSNKLLTHHFDIVDFIEGNEMLSFSPKAIIELARTLHELHSSVIFSSSGDRFPPNNSLTYKCKVFDEFAAGQDKQIETYKKMPGIEILNDPFNKKRGLLGKWFKNLKCFKNCSQFCLCHADLKAENIIETTDGIKLIDWECADSDIAETDIGRLFSGCQFSKIQEDLFLKEYFHKKVKSTFTERIYAVKKVLDFFRILEDYIILKRKPWNAENMLDEIIRFKIPNN